MPVTMPKLVAIGAEQSPRRRTITWHGTAISNSSTLPFNSHETTRVVTAVEFLKYK